MYLIKIVITTKKVSFSCIFLSGIYKNAAIDWFWAVFGKNTATPTTFTKHSPKISSIATFFDVWAAFYGFGLDCILKAQL